MATNPETLEHALDLFGDLGPLRRTRFFGGTALYLDDAMFAVLLMGAIFMKCDEALAKDYAAAGSTPFRYDTKTGERVIHGLMSLPDSAMDDPEEALDWARRSLVPARIAAAEKAKARR